MRYSNTRPPAPTEAHGCEQLAQSCYSTMSRPVVEPATSRLQLKKLKLAVDEIGGMAADSEPTNTVESD